MHDIRDEEPPDSQLGKKPNQSDQDRGQRAKRLRLLAAIFGLAGAVLALLVPFLPVKQQVVTLDWPTQQGTRAISAPVTAQAPLRLDAQVPCQAARDLDQRVVTPGTLFNTNAPNSDYGKLTGMALTVNNGLLTLTSQGQQLGTVPVGPADCVIRVHSDSRGTTAEVGNQVLVSDDDDQRPQVTGIFSDLRGDEDYVTGLAVSVEVDNRWDTHATLIKWLTIALSVIGFVGSAWALHRLDRLTGRRPPRLAPKGWWKLKPLDMAVIGALVVWWLIGAMTADDGYFLTMARVREQAGYIGEYYRWYGTADSPMAWFVDVYSAMANVSTLTPWMRLPALIMGIACWFLISREVLPRLGQQVRRSKAAGWAAGAVFLAFWMPYNNGLRPENIVAVLSLISLCAVERAVATRRLLPVGLGLATATLSVATNPHGLMAVLPFIVAGKPLLRIIRHHVRQFGWLPVLAPIAASGFVILNLIFYDQTIAGAMDATKLRASIGPSQAWYQELARYVMLFTDGPDGSMTRRFPVLLVMLCIATCVVVLLRRGNIRGAALGPSRRLLAMSALAFLVLALTPTKHSHHFGMLAAVGGGLAALTALATSTTVLLSRRNRAGFFAALMFIAAFAATGPNAWWYASSWGVPWLDGAPRLFGISLSALFLLAAGIAFAVAVVEHIRLDEHKPFMAPSRSDRSGVENRGRALRLGTAPLSIVCTLLVLFEIGSLAKAIEKRWDSYSGGADNVKQLVGQSCGLSDYIFVEQSPLDGVLTPNPNQPSTAAPDWELPDDASLEETPTTWLRPGQRNFVAGGGLPPEPNPDPAMQKWKPPYDLGGATAPIWGSYEPTGYGTGEIRTQWYPIPQRARDGDVPVVVAIAGQTEGTVSLSAEFGRQTPNGFEVIDRQDVTADDGPTWRDARITPGGDHASEAEQVRIVAMDKGLGADAWLAFSAPRVPQLSRMTDVIGDAPTFLEWTASFQHPCLRPSGIQDGIAEVPRYRVSAGGSFRTIGQSWSSPDAGGPFGWLYVATSVRELPTYLKGDVDWDWGTLYEVDPYGINALPAEVALHKEPVTRSGFYSSGPFVSPAHLPGNVPDSDNRADLDDTEDDE